MGYDESPAEFTHRSDQANTDMNDPEAYERDMISGAKFVNEGATSTDSQLLADTSGHKTGEWLARETLEKDLRIIDSKHGAT